LLDFYRGKGILKEVDGLGEIPEITERILYVLK
jgi:adenylate kinase family enzyme